MNRIICVLIVLLLPCVFPGVAASETIPNFDASRSARLSIHKTSSTSDTVTEPLAGVVFRVTKVEGIDLSNNEGWAALTGIDARTIQQQPDKLGAPVEATTSNAGVAVFSDLPLGVYLVEEQPARIGDVSYSVTAPFLVALPMNMGDGFNYDVTVQAKNQPISITKTASVDKTTAGEKISYQLSSTIPAPDRAGKLFRYVIKDALPQGVKYHGMSLKIVGKDVPELRETQDYTTEYNVERHEVLVTFTPAGLEVLAGVRHRDSSAHVRTDIEVTVSAKAGDTLDNTAVLYPDGYNPETSEGIASNKHRLEVSGKSGDDGDGRNKDSAAPGKTPPVVNPSTAPTGQPGPGERDAGHQDKSTFRVGKLALTGAGIYGICIAGAAALFAGAALIYYRDKRQRKAKL